MSDGASIFNAFNQKPEKAIELLNKLGIDVSKETFEEMIADAEQRAYVLSKITQADLLEDVRRELVKALEEGKPFSEFKKDMRTRLARRGWDSDDPDDATGEAAKLSTAWRLNVIYRQNLQTALQAGRYIQQATVADRRPYLVYDAVTDNRTTDLCLVRDGIILRADDPWWALNYPPNHWLCRAAVYSMSEHEFLRNGGELTDVKDLEGIEALPMGFKRNPTEPFVPNYKKYEEDLAERLRKALKS